MNHRKPIAGRAAAGASMLIAVAACSVSTTNDAPIVERSHTTSAPRAAAPAPAERSPAPAAREAHEGVYAVQAGDTLYSIALAFGQDYRDIARWNGLDPADHLHVGQSLRVAPQAPEESGAAAVEATAVPVAPTGTVESHPLAPAQSAAPDAGKADSSAAPSLAPAAAAGAPAPAAAPAPTADRPAAAAQASAAEPEGSWAWPGAGKLLERFEQTHNKGIDIAGSVGDPVWAANDGQVVYSGSGLRDYGKLVIIKHTDDYVSVYAHNNEILVTQGQAVKRGQRIADLGMTGAPTPRLHFEIRRRGTPVDPLAYLPSR
jgi:lipoprotein NlpD